MSSDERERQVADLSRRVAHASFALICAWREHVMAVTAAEIMMYDMEALSPVATGQALVNARRQGLAGYLGTYWYPTSYCMDLEKALEDRVLAEQDETA